MPRQVRLGRVVRANRQDRGGNQVLPSRRGQSRPRGHCTQVNHVVVRAVGYLFQTSRLAVPHLFCACPCLPPTFSPANSPSCTHSYRAPPIATRPPSTIAACSRATRRRAPLSRVPAQAAMAAMAVAAAAAAASRPPRRSPRASFSRTTDATAVALTRRRRTARD